METNIDFMVKATEGVLCTPFVNTLRFVSGITWDSREITPGCVFLTLEGENVDGNDFVIPAISTGATCVIMTRDPSLSVLAIAGEFDCAVIKVDDARLALRKLAQAYRLTLDASVVAVTGSTGKTTTKDIIASVLAMNFKTVSTEGNHNNELGVPHTILAAHPDTEALVVEIGMRGAGQITDLSSLVLPKIGVITNIGVTHMELLGSQENIACAKGELLTALPEHGVAILPGDDPFTPFILEHCPHRDDLRILLFGLGENCDIRATDIVYSDKGMPSFNLMLPDGKTSHVYLRLQGAHNVLNALAAAAVGFVLGMSSRSIGEGLILARPGAMRLETRYTKNGAMIINDAYNANPDSMRAALSTLQEMKVIGRRIAVLGDMGELGDGAPAFHREIGIFAARSGIELILCVGELSREIAAAAKDAGMPEKNVIICKNVAETLEYLTPELKQGDVVLVKASRSMGLERVVKGLVD